MAQLNCDATCVSTCTTAALTIDAKAACLDTCKCYATPAVVVPAAPVVAPVVTPVVAEPVVTPVVAEPVVTPVVADAVVVDAEPAAAEGAAQALFLSEANLVKQATGGITGAFLVAMILVLVTLLGAAILHLEEKRDLVKKAKAWTAGFRKTASTENEEYLLIK